MRWWLLLIQICSLSSHGHRREPFPGSQHGAGEVMRVPLGGSPEWLGRDPSELPSLCSSACGSMSTGNSSAGVPGVRRRQRHVPCAGHTAGREATLCQRDHRARVPITASLPVPPDQHRSLLWDQSLGPSAPVPGLCSCPESTPQTWFPWPDGNCCQTSRQGDGSLHLEAPDGLVSSSLILLVVPSIQKLQDLAIQGI